MAALNLHHATFTNEKDPNLPLRSAASFLYPAPERDGSPTSHLFSSAAYQDLIQRQPTHPDGPMSGWDLGLNLLGDPITAAEHKCLEDHRTKMKLRRLHAINIGFELLFGIWGTYTTIRYSLVFDNGLGGIEHVCALILGIMSVFAVALVIFSVLAPLFPRQGHPHAWRYTRSLLRASYLLLLSAGAMMNLVLVLLWHPSQLCNWDIDISWYISAANTTALACHTAPFAAWTAAAVLRLVMTLALALLFIYTLRSYHRVRHPTSEGPGAKYSPYSSSDAEEISPIITSSRLRFSKSTYKFTRSDDSNHTLYQSNLTFPKSNSISTLAPSTSCTGHSRSHSTPPPRDISLPRISPPTSRRASTNTTSHGSALIQVGSETPLQVQFVNGVIGPASAHHTLRRTSRIPAIQVAPDTPQFDMSPCLERLNGPTTAYDSPEIRSRASWKPGHHGSGAHPDVRKTTLAWEKAHVVRHVSQTGAGPESFSTTHNDGESVEEYGMDDAVVYSYGYGASGPTYPYLDMYNPQGPGEYAEGSSYCEDVDEDGLLRGHRRAVPGGPAIPDASSEPRSSPSRDEEDEDESGGEEEEYVAMMGGFVRRMATIESLGSKEAAGTLSTTGSVAPHSMRSGAPTSQFSSVRFAEVESSSCTPSSLGMSSASGTEGSLSSTAYLSFSSGGTDTRVNECGELVQDPGCLGSRDAAGSSCDRVYYAASAGRFPEDG